MIRSYYSDTIDNFISSPEEVVLGILTKNSDFATEVPMRESWIEEINVLKRELANITGKIYFEYSIPRMGKRIDVVLLVGPVIFIIEFKVGEKKYPSSFLDQVCDYALDLKYFHETSHDQFIIPILVSTKAPSADLSINNISQHDRVSTPIKCNENDLNQVISAISTSIQGPPIIPDKWESGRYCPTPTIIEAALALYNNHTVQDILRNDASSANINQTSEELHTIIQTSRQLRQKSICFVTGVPGSGKTLVGLNIATNDKYKDTRGVFLSGNGPLVAVLREALTRDKYKKDKMTDKKVKKYVVMKNVKKFIQNVHNFRDEYIVDTENAPDEHIVIFDEAQRAWTKEQTRNFMSRRKRIPNFNISEPEFLISCLDRHKDWATIVCLVGGGQEINTGEAGISEWIDSVNRSFPDWHIYISPHLRDSEYAAGGVLAQIQNRSNVHFSDYLHLSVSMRSFRADIVSTLVKQILDLDKIQARQTLSNLNTNYPIILTRDIHSAKKWLIKQARGSERYGLVVSSQAERLKPLAIDVKTTVDPVHWFLDYKDDVRSSYYLEDVATEFHIQGLELDWVCLVWDGDFRYSSEGWKNWSFCGNKWRHIHKQERMNYQKNAYRVLLTRARQGMVIVVPAGDTEDPTRRPEYYNSTYNYLKEIGFHVI
jgi:hypothetical protein